MFPASTIPTAILSTKLGSALYALSQARRVAQNQPQHHFGLGNKDKDLVAASPPDYLLLLWPNTEIENTSHTSRTLGLATLSMYD